MRDDQIPDQHGLGRPPSSNLFRQLGVKTAGGSPSKIRKEEAKQAPAPRANLQQAETRDGPIADDAMHRRIVEDLIDAGCADYDHWDDLSNKPVAARR